MHNYTTKFPGQTVQQHGVRQGPAHPAGFLIQKLAHHHRPSAWPNWLGLLRNWATIPCPMSFWALSGWPRWHRFLKWTVNTMSKGPLPVRKSCGNVHQIRRNLSPPVARIFTRTRIFTRATAHIKSCPHRQSSDAVSTNRTQTFLKSLSDVKQPLGHWIRCCQQQHLDWRRDRGDGWDISRFELF